MTIPLSITTSGDNKIYESWEALKEGFEINRFLEESREILFQMEWGFTYRSILLQYEHRLSAILYCKKVMMVLN